MDNLVLTLTLARDEVATFSALVFILISGFAFAGFQAFGDSVPNFRTLAKSYFTLFAGLFDDDLLAGLYTELHAVNRFYGPLYFFMFSSFLTLTIMNIVIAILNSSFVRASARFGSGRVRTNERFAQLQAARDRQCKRAAAAARRAERMRMRGERAGEEEEEEGSSARRRPSRRPEEAADKASLGAAATAVDLVAVDVDSVVGGGGVPGQQGEKAYATETEKTSQGDDSGGGGHRPSDVKWTPADALAAGKAAERAALQAEIEADAVAEADARVDPAAEADRLLLRSGREGGDGGGDSDEDGDAALQPWMQVTDRAPLCASLHGEQRAESREQRAESREQRSEQCSAV
jgi:hypothetical protein